MRILHYSLGFPPQRSGGLVTYSLDLIKEQLRMGESVFLLYPGNVDLFNKKARIRMDRKHSKQSFYSYKLVNSLPLPLFGGIKVPRDFMKKTDENMYVEFLKKTKPDIIHVHTLMGLHLEFFKAAKKLNIKIVMTTNDYFGIAPEPTFFYQNKNYVNSNTIRQWKRISETALTTKKLRLFQNPLYYRTKQFVKKLGISKDSFSEVKKVKKKKFDESSEIAFSKLKKYYLSILSTVDKFHFNSTITKEIYLKELSKYINNVNYNVISITNSQISKENTNFFCKSSKVKIGYIGPNEDYKGFNDFCYVAQKMSGRKYEFHTFGYIPRIKKSCLIEHGRYNFADLPRVYSNIDILVVPSKCYETFGLITLEALSFHKKVFVSSNVGSKDLLSSSCIFNDKKELEKMLRSSNAGGIPNAKMVSVKTMSEHAKEIDFFYKKIGKYE